MYCILNYTKIKPRSRPPQKKSAYFTLPDFSAAKIEKKCANYTSKYGIYIYIYTHTHTHTILITYYVLINFGKVKFSFFQN